MNANSGAVVRYHQNETLWIRRHQIIAKLYLYYYQVNRVYSV